MNILFLTPQLPYPPQSGGVIKSYQLIRYLSSEHAVTMVCLLKSERDIKNLPSCKKEFATVSIHEFPLMVPRNSTNFVRSCVAQKPLTIYRNYSVEIAKLVNKLCKNTDLLFVDHYLMFQYVPKSFEGRVIVHEHNAEFVIWLRRANLEEKWLMKTVLNFEANRIKKYEVKMCKKADVILATNNDKSALIQAGVSAKQFHETRHIGVQRNLTEPRLEYHCDSLTLLYVGTLTWEPNIDGLLWFAQTVWPILKQKKPAITLNVVGHCSLDIEGILKSKIDDIRVFGFASELESFYRNNMVFIAPYRYGSGVKVKVVNALYRGLPVVTTSVGAEGLEIQHGEEVLIANNPQQFAKNILSLLEQPELWRKLSVNSRNWAKQNYSWDVEEQSLRNCIEI